MRYGNVMGSRGSVIPFFMENAKSGKLTITDKRMTRFMISLEQGVELVWHAFDDMEGGEIYVKKISSMNICDIAIAVDASAEQVEIGIRPGEKLHELMMGVEDAYYTYEYPEHYKILPQICEWGSFDAMIITCFIALIVYRYLEKKLDNKYTIDQIISTLQEMNFMKYEGKGYQPVYTRSVLTDALHEAFGFCTSKQIVPIAKMKNIISQTKK